MLLRFEAAIESHDGGAHEAQRVRHSRMPGSRTGHLGAVVGNENAFELIAV